MDNETKILKIDRTQDNVLGGFNNYIHEKAFSFMNAENDSDIERIESEIRGASELLYEIAYLHGQWEQCRGEEIPKRLTDIEDELTPGIELQAPKQEVKC